MSNNNIKNDERDMFRICFSTALAALLNSHLRFRHAPSLPESPPDFLLLEFVPFWQGLPKVMARCRQGVGILIAYSNRPFEYGNTVRTLCEVREKGMASPNENEKAELPIRSFLSVPLCACSVHPPCILRDTYEDVGFMLAYP